MVRGMGGRGAVVGRQRWRESREKLPLLLDIHTETPLKAVVGVGGGGGECIPTSTRSG